MSAPWPQTHGFTVKTLSNPYIRMMNTSGIFFKDHAGSMVINPPPPSYSPYPRQHHPTPNPSTQKKTPKS